MVRTLLLYHRARMEDADYAFLCTLRAKYEKLVLSQRQRKRLRDVAAKHGA
jgi:hypothetical protein